MRNFPVETNGSCYFCKINPTQAGDAQAQQRCLIARSVPRLAALLGRGAVVAEVEDGLHQPQQRSHVVRDLHACMFCSRVNKLRMTRDRQRNRYLSNRDGDVESDERVCGPADAVDEGEHVLDAPRGDDLPRS